MSRECYEQSFLLQSNKQLQNSRVATPAVIRLLRAVAVAGYFLRVGLILYFLIFQGTKMSLFSYSAIAFLCMDHLRFWGAIEGVGNFSDWGGIAPT